MKYYFCLVNQPDSDSGLNIGKTYAYNHRSQWKEMSAADISAFLTVGYVKGVDHVVSDGKVYMIMKTYIDINENFVVFICKESVTGCDI